jgi:hypothetical protein
MQANEQRKVETPESPDDDFLPLTAEQAAQWRQRNPVVSVWQVVFWQVGVGIVLAALAGWWSGRWMVAASVLYGSAAVFVPAALLLGLVVTMKVYWLALAWRPRPLKQDPWIKS